jgi:hypothetical protein
MRILLATLLAFTALAPAAVAQTPDVVTGDAAPGATTATLNGTVDPNGVQTSYHFEWGTGTDPTTGLPVYGLESPTQSAGSGSDPVAVQATISGLSANTTYHYRLVAGDQKGADRTFKTTTAPVNPTVPGISRLSAQDKTTSSARLTALIDPNRAATTWHVEWGTSSTQLGSRSPDATLPAGNANVAISVPVSDLPTHTKIYWRVVASNAAGTKRSGVASFTTLRAPSGIALRVFPDRADWAGSVNVSGRVEGSGVNGLTVALEQSSFPYSAGWQEVATARTGKSGDFRFAARQLFAAARFRAITRTAVSVTSAPIEALVRARVGIRTSRKTRRKVVLAGRVQPGLPDGRATLQRRTRRGGWAFVRRVRLRTPATDMSTYRVKVRRLRRAAYYRIKVAANDRGAHLGNTSRAVLVGKRKRR